MVMMEKKHQNMWNMFSPKFLFSIQIKKQPMSENLKTTQVKNREEVQSGSMKLGQKKGYLYMRQKELP